MWGDARPLLEVQDLHAGYDSDDVVRGASLHVAAGEIVCVVGPSGAGKSTLLKALYGLVAVRRGRVLFDDRDITGIRPQDALRSAGITFVPQEASLFPRMTVRENLELGMYLARDRALVRKHLSTVNELFPQLARRARDEAGAISDAEQRMLELGRALMWAPRLAIIDELSGGLDPEVAAAIFDSIRQLNAGTGLTVLMADRSALPGLGISHRGYLMERGRQTFEGSGQELLRSDAVARSLRSSRLEASDQAAGRRVQPHVGSGPGAPEP